MLIKDDIMDLTINDALRALKLPYGCHSLGAKSNLFSFNYYGQPWIRSVTTYKDRRTKPRACEMSAKGKGRIILMNPTNYSLNFVFECRSKVEMRNVQVYYLPPNSQDHSRYQSDMKKI